MRRTLTLCLLTSALAAGCGSHDESAQRTTSSAASGEPIVIGTANSLTGALAPFETAINEGMEIAADEINKAGGVKGRPIRFVHVDAKSDPNLSATATLSGTTRGRTPTSSAPAARQRSCAGPPASSRARAATSRSSSAPAPS